MIHFFINFNSINNFSASLDVSTSASTRNINYKGRTLAHFVLRQFLIFKRALPIPIFLIALNLPLVCPVVDWQVILLIFPDLCR